ncbi:DUF4760 domain-containing protein [Alteromonas pelagimontana]|uniref:DUF4760 domain-containing protein n=1 Tax=Alteromonas pelagimontana TaxID=1858656 RepID=A0A6M4MGM0_9ALTE|nr:DUF4760 domain-containing protein [Alteromonas pelagimontana]QJR82269.1 DUF4760 domain-containing protein [Alteromonas pelagimontana]
MKKRTKLNYILAATIILVSLGGIFVIHQVDEKLISAIAILLSASLALTAALLNLAYSRQTAREANSLDFQKRLQDNKAYLKHIRKVGEAIARRSELDFAELAQPEHRSNEYAKSIRYVLNTWEQASNAIRHDLYDELYLYEAYKSMVIDFGFYFREFIISSQKRQVTFYENFSWLVLKWVIRRDSIKEKERKAELSRIFKKLNKLAQKNIH